jgi:hypothetical protein
MFAMRNSASANFTETTTAAAVLVLCWCCAAGAGAGAGVGAAGAAGAAAGAGVGAAPQWTESSREIPMADRRWSSLPLSVPFPRRPNPTTVTSLSLSLSLSPRGIPRGPPPLVGPVRRGSDPANKALAGGRVFRVRCRRDPPWPTAGPASALLPLY